MHRVETLRIVHVIPTTGYPTCLSSYPYMSEGLTSSTSRRPPTKSLLTLEEKGFKLGTGGHFGKP